MVLAWPTDVYVHLERSILSEGLRFKTDFVSSAQAIFETLCTYVEVSEMKDHEGLEKLLHEALFRSYICLNGKFASFGFAITRG